MPDPIRVTQAVRRCPLCRGRGYSGEPDNPNETPCPNCSDGQVDVPVDKQCPTCRGNPADVLDCPDCGGSGRRSDPSRRPEPMRWKQ